MVIFGFLSIFKNKILSIWSLSLYRCMYFRGVVWWTSCCGWTVSYLYLEAFSLGFKQYPWVRPIDFCLSFWNFWSNGGCLKWMVKEGNSCSEGTFSQPLHLTLPSALLGPLSSKPVEFHISRRICCVWNVNLSGNHLNSTLRSSAGWASSLRGDPPHRVSPSYLLWWLHAGQRAYPSISGASVYHAA